jgi:predicted porin
MKKSLIALAVLGAYVGAASAQSSVTIFGIVDLSVAQVKNDGTDARKSMNSNALNSNRLGFRGVEDLGGGMRAGFHLEGGMTNDNGNAGGLTFLRRSTVSLLGGFGELRLGRDYTPNFWNTTVFDPFGTNGVGNSLNTSRAAQAKAPAPNPTGVFAVQGAQGNAAGNTGVKTYVRSDNSVGYFLPAMGGVYGQLMLAPGEGVSGKYTGGRIGFAAGPVNVAAGFGTEDITASGSRKFKSFNVAGSYKIGSATLMAQYNDEKFDPTPATAAVAAVPAVPGNAGTAAIPAAAAIAERKETRLLFGANIVVGQGEIRASFVRTDQKLAGGFDDDDASQIALGYIYNLSPRTALYTTYASISNKGRSNFSVYGGTANAGGPIAALPTAGGKSTGIEGGLRHSF